MAEKKLSRRDAMKLLGAAIGAAALANIPSKWNTPELAAGVLPAHARQSVVPPHTLAADPDDNNANFCGALTSRVTITPNDIGIVMRYVIVPAGTPPILAVPATGIKTTGAGGIASLSIWLAALSFNANDTVTVTWTFENAPGDGSGSDAQVFTVLVASC